jgi:hypothetical protein
VVRCDVVVIHFCMTYYSSFRYFAYKNSPRAACLGQKSWFCSVFNSLKNYSSLITTSHTIIQDNATIIIIVLTMTLMSRTLLFSLPLRPISLHNSIQPAPCTYFSSTTTSHQTTQDRNALNRWKYNNDPEYRRLRAECNARYYKRRLERDPTYREKLVQNLARLRADPVWRERELQMRNARYANDQVRREQQLRRTQESRLRHPDTCPRNKKANMESYHTDLVRRRNILLATWIRLGNHSRTKLLEWSDHVLVQYHDKTKHLCSGCMRERALKLWWQRKVDSKYDCHRCFTLDWSRALPKGYEHLWPDLKHVQQPDSREEGAQYKRVQEEGAQEEGA